jgi:hypothetical protein
MKPVLSVLAIVAAQMLGQASTPVAPMAAEAHPSFAVATVKPHDPNYPHRQGWNFIGDRVRIENQTVGSMLMYAYAINPHQIADLP